MLYKNGKQVKHIYKRSYNLLGFKTSMFKKNDGDLYTYFNLTDYLPDGQYTLSIEYKDGINADYFKPNAGGRYFGLTRNGSNANNGVYWLLNAGAINRTFYTFSIKKDNPAKGLNYVSIYGSLENDVNDILSNLNIQIIEGTTAKPYLPYLIDVSKVYKNGVCVFSNLKATETNNILTLNNTEVNNSTATLEGENTSVNNNVLIIE